MPRLFGGKLACDMIAVVKLDAFAVPQAPLHEIKYSGGVPEVPGVKCHTALYNVSKIPWHCWKSLYYLCMAIPFPFLMVSCRVRRCIGLARIGAIESPRRRQRVVFLTRWTSLVWRTPSLTASHDWTGGYRRQPPCFPARYRLAPGRFWA